MSGSLTLAFCSSCKRECLAAKHDFTLTTGSVFKAALFRAAASLVGTYGAATTNYSQMLSNGDEVASGGGYTSGGLTLTNVSPVLSGTVAYASFNTATWSAATFTASGILVYNSSYGNATVMVLPFGQDWAPSSANLVYTFPAFDASNAVIRIGG